MAPHDNADGVTAGGAVAPPAQLCDRSAMPGEARSGATIGTVARAVLAGYAAHPLLLAGALAAMLYQVGFNLFLPIATRRLFDDVLPSGDRAALRELALVLVGSLVVRVAVAVAQERWMASLAARAMATTRARMFAALQAKPASYFARTSSAELLSRFSSDLAVVENATSRLVPRGLYVGLNIIACTTLMAILDARLAGVIVATLLVVVLGPRALGRRAASANAARRDAETAVLATVHESIALSSVVRAFGLERWVGDAHDKKLGTFRTEARRATFAGSMVETFTVLAFAGVQVLVLCVGGWLALSGEVSPGLLVAFTGLVATVSGSMFGVSAILPPLIESAAGFARVRELLASDDDDDAARVELPPLASRIRLDDVDFSYTGARMDIKNLALDIPAGTSAAFVGPSGSGKSTALSLITRANAPQRGRVLFDDHDLAAAAPRSLYAQLAVVAQESLLFDASIRDNIRAGRLGASDADIEAAAKRAEIHDAIVAMPDGYLTRVGERGSKLSGGQRQRIAIARAVLRDPRVFVLDEATSALDPGTEAAVARTLGELGRGRTTIAVTHRLSTVVGYDQIFVLDRGELVERGRHDELVARGGLYAQLWKKQSGVTISDAGDAMVTPDFLGSIPLFESLDVATRGALARRFATMTFAAEHVLFQAGDPGDGFYIIARGLLDIIVPGEVETRRTYGVGDSIGEIALLDSRPRAATARTRTPCTMLVLSRAHFHELVEREPAVAAELRRKARDHLEAGR
jgi:ATP-binding cassette subfamily B protein